MSRIDNRSGVNTVIRHILDHSRILALGEITCKISIFTGYTSLTGSLYTLCMISLDRLLLVLKKYPQYMQIQSKFRIKVTIAIVWTLTYIQLCWLQ